MSTVLDLLTNAMAEIGAVAQGETLSANDAAFCLSKANRMLNSWRTRRLNAYCIAKNEYAFGTSKQSYTIGPSGADFTATRPERIDSANVILVSSDNARIQLWVVNVKDYAALQLPALSSIFPTRLYYQATFPNGTLYPWPYPTTATNKLELFTWQQIAEFASLGADLSLPPGYEDAITYSLAEALCPAYGREISASLHALALEARTNIRSLNIDTPRQSSDLYPGPGEWDYRTGGLR